MTETDRIFGIGPVEQGFYPSDNGPCNNALRRQVATSLCIIEGRVPTVV